MEEQGISRKVRFSLSHLPTLFLIAGYPIYWLELYLFRAGQGKTTPLAWAIVVFISLIVLFQNRINLLSSILKLKDQFLKEYFVNKFFVVFLAVFGGATIFFALYASLLPPHLVQEFDALNYHITIPRQHLILGSFRHITWSTADLYLLPVDFALAPFWLATALPNKLPQFFFVAGLLGVCFRLARSFSKGEIWPAILVVLAILGSHNIGIQLGTAMLDIAICYLFIAALDSFLNQRIWLGAIELSFYFWSKPLIPLQFIVTLVIFALLLLFLRIYGIRNYTWMGLNGQVKETFRKNRPVFIKVFGIFIALSLFLAGPFLLKSLRCSATPIFPLGVGAFSKLSVEQSPERQVELKSKAKELLGVRDNYGYGRGLSAFIKHFWLIAVPDKGVNNRYDYPLGLMYLLFAGPFIFFFIRALRNKRISLLSLWVISSWAVWWLGSQQTRFLYIPLILMYLIVSVSIRTPSRVLLFVMLAAVLMVSVSVYRANKPDFGRWGEEVLRRQDQELIMLSKDKEDNTEVTLTFCDAAFAEFPVKVIDNDTLFVLKTEPGR